MSFGMCAGIGSRRAFLSPLTHPLVFSNYLYNAIVAHAFIIKSYNSPFLIQIKYTSTINTLLISHFLLTLLIGPPDRPGRPLWYNGVGLFSLAQRSLPLGFSFSSFSFWARISSSFFRASSPM